MLTDTALKLLKPQGKLYKRGDEKCLFVIVRPDGALWWRFKYRFQGREKQLSLGTYPDTSLKLAREKRDDARRLLAANVDPSVNRQIEKAARSHTFETVAREWLGKLQLSPDTVGQLRHRLETYVFLHPGRYPIKTIVAADLLRVLRRIEANGTYETVGVQSRVSVRGGVRKIRSRPRSGPNRRIDASQGEEFRGVDRSERGWCFAESH